MEQQIKVCPRCTAKNRVNGRKGPLCGRCGISLEATLYDILDVPKDAKADEMKRAYKKMVLMWHPDRNQDNPLAPLIFTSILHSYRVLSNPAARAAYDAQLTEVCVSSTAGEARTTASQKPSKKAAATKAAAAQPKAKEPFPLSVVLYAVTAVLTMSAVSLF